MRLINIGVWNGQLLIITSNSSDRWGPVTKNKKHWGRIVKHYILPAPSDSVSLFYCVVVHSNLYCMIILPNPFDTTQVETAPHAQISKTQTPI